MRIGVPKETVPGERRVALTPEGVARLIRAGAEVVVQAGAGDAAGFSDAAYEAAGAGVSADAVPVFGSDVVVKVQAPTESEIASLHEGKLLVGLLQSATPEILIALARRRVTALAMELVPRTTRAQSMDALSSQATVAGYKALLLGATSLPRFLPMLTTAAGTVPPARVFVIGAGVAGLQAIATARRLGAIVSAFDVRPVVREQVQSLGATFVEADAVGAGAEAAGGYARELQDAERERVAAAIARHIRDMDLVVTTAQVPGRPAPRIVTEAMIRSMKPGSVVVDLAAESGGNCEVTRAGETVNVDGVSVIGPVNLPASLPYHASQMFGRNIEALVRHLFREGQIVVSPADEITGPMIVTHAGEVSTR